MVKTILLALILGTLVISSLLLISSTNPVHAIITLILIFLNATGLLLLEQLEFMGFILIIVYVGAIAVLFLFVVMLLNIKVLEVNVLLSRYLPIGVFLASIFLIEILFVYQAIAIFNTESTLTSAAQLSFESAYINLISPASNVEMIGLFLYEKGHAYLLLTAYILLLAMVGAIKLTLRQRRSKRQDAFEQVSRKISISLFK